MRKFSVTKQAEGWVALDCRGKIISGPHDEEWKAHLYGTHAACAPSPMKTLKLKNRDGMLKGWPFYGTYVEIEKTEAGNWELRAEVDGSDRGRQLFKTRKEAFSAVFAIGRETVKTYNILNREAGEFDIDRASRGGCCDPATERYHSM